MRLAAFEHLRRLTEVHDHLTAALLRPGFEFDGARMPLINRWRAIFKPKRMRFLLSIKTVVPKSGGKVWYDDQREAHRQIYRSKEAVDYAFVDADPDAADNYVGEHLHLLLQAQILSGLVPIPDVLATKISEAAFSM